MDVMRQDCVYLPQNVLQKNVDDMRRKTSIVGRFVVRMFCGVTMPLVAMITNILHFKVFSKYRCTEDTFAMFGSLKTIYDENKAFAICLTINDKK